MKRKIIALFFLIWSALTLVSQEPAILRLELNARMNEDTYTLIPCGENGFIVFYQGFEDKSGNMSWHFAMFDNQLKELWIRDTVLPNGLVYNGYYYEDDLLYMLYYHEGRGGSGDYNAKILTVALMEGMISTKETMFPEKSTIGGFTVRNNKAVTGATDKKNVGYLIFTDLSSGESVTTEIDLEGASILRNIYLDPDQELGYVLVQNILNKENSGYVILPFDLHGRIKEILHIDPVLEGKYLNDADLLLREGKIYIFGTYGSNPARLSGNTEEDFPESTGYYMACFENGREKFIHYYNFLEFDNLYRTLGGKDVTRLRKKAGKQERTGEEVSLDYNVLLHPVLLSNDVFLVMSEAFYPEYRTVTDMYYDYYGRMVPQTYTVFDGFKYFAGIVSAFDMEGQMVWNGEMPIWNIQTFNLQPYLQLFGENDEFFMFYNRNGRIQYSVFRGGSELEKDASLEIKLKYDNDKLIDDARSKIVHWYNEFFLCYGYQEIRNNRLANNRRAVFYVNKVALK
ncbi:MAG: hypothetical protein KKA81_11405 [Bacteroidetes bacterium]|nr:hypothetical protein [Bacteroidota bacterium]